MGSKVSTCTDDTVKYDPNKDGALFLKKDTKTPNFMQKVKLSCKSLKFSTTDSDVYKVDIVTDLAVIIPIGVAALLVLFLIIWMVMKMRRHEVRSE
jgi:hypothetical protein